MSSTPPRSGSLRSCFAGVILLSMLPTAGCTGEPPESETSQDQRARQQSSGTGGRADAGWSTIPGPAIRFAGDPDHQDFGTVSVTGLPPRALEIFREIPLDESMWGALLPLYTGERLPADGWTKNST